MESTKSGKAYVQSGAGASSHGCFGSFRELPRSLPGWEGYVTVFLQRKNKGGEADQLLPN